MIQEVGSRGSLAVHTIHRQTTMASVKAVNKFTVMCISKDNYHLEY